MNTSHHSCGCSSHAPHASVPAQAAAAPAPSTAGHEVSPAQASERLRAGSILLVDVRESDEHARERIEGARLVPLSKFQQGAVASLLGPGQGLVLHCRSGRRSADACRMAAGLARQGTEVLSMSGGIEGWKAAGLPTVCDAAAPAISIMRQVQLVIGLCVLVGCALAWIVDPRFIAVPAFFGAGLTFAGATGTCALASLVSKMPWNCPQGRAGGGGSGGPHGHSGGSCCSGSGGSGTCCGH